MHTENYETLLKEIKDDVNKWKDFLTCGLEDSTAKLTTLPREICRCNAISIKIVSVKKTFFTAIEKSNLNSGPRRAGGYCLRAAVRRAFFSGSKRNAGEKESRWA